MRVIVAWEQLVPAAAWALKVIARALVAHGLPVAPDPDPYQLLLRFSWADAFLAKPLCLWIVRVLFL